MTIAIYAESCGVSLGLVYDPLLEVFFVCLFDLGWALTPVSRFGNGCFGENYRAIYTCCILLVGGRFSVVVFICPRRLAGLLFF
jgi:hypothetical protein